MIKYLKTLCGMKILLQKNHPTEVSDMAQSSVFSQVIKLIYRRKFEAIVHKHKGNKGLRSLDCWTWFGSLLFGQLTGHDSIRAIERIFATSDDRMKKLGFGSVRRSTLVDSNRTRGHICDQLIYLKSQRGQKYQGKLRRITYRDPQTNKRLTFLTNRMDLATQTICDLYKARWKVELFFKTMKQYLRIKKFLGTSAHAVKAQILVALIAYLLVQILRFLTKPLPSFSCSTRLSFDRLPWHPSKISSSSPPLT